MMDLIFPLASSAFLGDLRETRLLMFAPFDLPRDGVFKRDLGAVCAVFLLPFRALTIFFRLPKTFFAAVGNLAEGRDFLREPDCWFLFLGETGPDS